MRPDLAGIEGFVRNCWYVVGRSGGFARELSTITIYADKPAFSKRAKTATPEDKDVLERVYNGMAYRRGSYLKLALDATASPNPEIQNPKQTEP